MQLTLSRNYFREKYIIGKLFIEDDYFCDTFEPGFLLKEHPCIPAGSYEVVLNIKSPKFSRKWFYKQFCNGFVPRLLNVPGRDGILIHSGNDESQGCILVGTNDTVGRVNHSITTFTKLYKELLKSPDKIIINIINCPLDQTSYHYYEC